MILTVSAFADVPEDSGSFSKKARHPMFALQRKTRMRAFRYLSALKAAISARNSSPYRSSFFSPTPLTNKNASGVAGMRAHISRSALSEKTM